VKVCGVTLPEGCPYPGGFIFLFPRFWLHDLCAPASKYLASGLPGSTWSASHGSLGRQGPPQMWHWVVVARTCFANLL
jgi:hypothetical protein